MSGPITPPSPDREHEPLSVAITGSTGLIGGALAEALRKAGHTVVPVVRSSPGPDEVGWQPARGEIDSAGLEGMDAVVHLSGESIARHRWSRAQMERIETSRTRSTSLLARTLAGLKDPPRALLSASAIGYYGDAGDRELDETAEPGEGFLARLGVEWEAATRPAAEAGIRVVTMRNGIVLSRSGGALDKMLPIFRLGLGGRLGHGRQWMSWITLEDTIRAIMAILSHETVAGPVNVVAPGAVTNADFTRELASVLGRPAPFPVPAWALRLAVGPMADEALLASARVVPRRLEEMGFQFRHPLLPEALEAVLGTEGHESGPSS